MPNLTNINQSIITQQNGYGYITTLIAPFFTVINYPITNSLGKFSYWGTPNSTVTNSFYVADYNNHTLQTYVTGSGNYTSSITVQSSIDGVNWVTDFSSSISIFSANSSPSSINRLTGRRTYIQASLTGSGNVTSSLYLLSGQ